MSDIEQIELSIETAKKLVARRDQIMKLTSNREFRKVILEGYMEEEAVRLVSIAGDARMEKQRDDIMLGIQAISKFRIYMQDAIIMGDVAERELAQNQEMLDELRDEEDEVSE